MNNERRMDPLNKRIIRRLLKVIFGLIVEESFDKLDYILKVLDPEQCTNVLKATINGYTPLALAIKYKKVEISHYILEHSLRQGRPKMCESWKNSRHPLTVAVLGKNMELVRLIAQNMDDLNQYFDGPYTPLMLAVFCGNLEFVKLLIRLGADINRPCFNGGNPLIISTLYSEVCRYLVTQGAVINYQDQDGYTALHVAIIGQKMQSLKILVKAGADLSIRANDGMTPLMCAAAEMNLSAVMYLSKLPDYSELEKIEALEILGACLVCAQKPMLHLWKHALEMRDEDTAKSDLSTACEVFDFCVEFATEAELERLQNQPLKLAFQGVQVIDRLIGRNNSVYLRVLLQTALIAKHAHDPDKLQQLIHYIEDFCESLAPGYIAMCSLYFRNLFTAIARDAGLQTEAFVLYKIVAHTTVDIWRIFEEQYALNHRSEDSFYANIVDTFLHMTSMILPLIPSADYLDLYRGVVVKLIEADPRVINHQSLLHYAIKRSKTDPQNLMDLIRILLASGAVVGALDYYSRTPIMYAIKYAPQDNLKELVDILIQYGALPFQEDGEGYSAMDYPRWQNQYICPENPELPNLEL